MCDICNIDGSAYNYAKSDFINLQKSKKCLFLIIRNSNMFYHSLAIVASNMVIQK